MNRVPKFDLTISVVSYHNVKDIEKAIDSIETFTSSDIKKKIFIIDNGNTPEGFKKILSKFEDVVYVKNSENIGFGKAHNLMMRQYNSKFHAIVNPDILIKEDVFSVIMAKTSIKSKKILVPKLVDEENNLLPVYRRDITMVDLAIRNFFIKFDLFKSRNDYHTMQEQNFSEEFIVPFAQGSFLVMPTHFYKELNGFDERFFMYLEDADFCKRANILGEVLYFPYCSVIHKWKKGSHKSFKLLIYHTKSMVKYFIKWGFKFR